MFSNSAGHSFMLVSGAGLRRADYHVTSAVAPKFVGSFGGSALYRETVFSKDPGGDDREGYCGISIEPFKFQSVFG